MTELKTIDELMEGKVPGSIKVSCFADERYFIPFFKDDDVWRGLTQDGKYDAWCVRGGGWKLYTELKKTRKLRPAVFLSHMPGEPKARIFVSAVIYETEQDARDRFGDRFICMAPDAYEIEVEE